MTVQRIGKILFAQRIFKKDFVGAAFHFALKARATMHACGATQPPPYFPTTGRFRRGTYYQVDPVGFSIDSYFEMLSVN